MILSVDPGVNEAGFALWVEQAWYERSRPALPGETFVLKRRSRDTTFYRRVEGILNQLDVRLRGIEITGLYTEFPIMFSGAVGYAVARRGDLTHLAFAVGMFAEWARGRVARFICYPVNEWIGQLPKDVMHQRVRSILLRYYRPRDVDSVLQRPSHHWDAVGIGLYAQGFFN
jgi:hypothetical protein